MLWAKISTLALFLFVWGEQPVRAQPDFVPMLKFEKNPSKAKKGRHRTNPQRRFEQALQLFDEDKFLLSMEICERLLLETPENPKTRVDREKWLGAAIRALIAVFYEQTPKNVQYLEHASAILNAYEEGFVSAYGTAEEKSSIVLHWRLKTDQAMEAMGKEKQLLEEFKRIKSEAGEALERHEYARAAGLWQSAVTHEAAPRSGPKRVWLLFQAAKALLQAHDLKPEKTYLSQANQLLRQIHNDEEGKSNAEVQSEYRRLDHEVSQRQTHRSREPSLQPKLGVESTNDRFRRTKAWWIAGVSAGSGLTLAGAGLVVYGSTFEKRAEAEIQQEKEKIGVTKDEELDDGSLNRVSDHRTTNRKRGNANIVAGVATAAIGISGVIVGAIALKKMGRRSSKWQGSAKAWRPVASFDRRGLWLGISGKF